MKRIITITAFTALALAATGAHAQYAPGVEQAVSITPAFTSTTRTECSTAAPAGGGWLGQALGGILGAGVGSQVGKGSGQAAAAAAGAVLGAQAGAAMSDSNGTPTQTCRDITERTLTGYMMRTSSGRDVFLPALLVDSFTARGR